MEYNKEHIQALYDAANRMRISAIQMTCASKSGHPTSSCSAAEIVATLFFDEMRYLKDEPKHPSSDRFVLSKVANFILIYRNFQILVMKIHVTTMEQRVMMIFFFFFQ